MPLSDGHYTRNEIRFNVLLQKPRKLTTTLNLAMFVKQVVLKRTVCKMKCRSVYSYCISNASVCGL